MVLSVPTESDWLQPELGGPGCENLLVISPGEVNFYGTGKLAEDLNRHFSGGWYGGALPERGYWGQGKEYPPVEVLLDFLEKHLSLPVKNV